MGNEMDDGNYQQRRHAVVIGGGSAGHVHPGVAVAHQLVERGWSVSWIGRSDSFEQRLVAGAHLKFDSVPALPVVGRGILGKIRAGVVIMRGVLAARRVLKRNHAKAVLGTGGYVSVPGVLAAKTLGCRIVLFEPNATMGFGNRLLAPVANWIAWGHPGPKSRYQQAVTGVPVNDSFESAPYPDADSPFRILILGGSQGSEELNQVVPGALSKLDVTAAETLQVTHQCGAQHQQATKARYQKVRSSIEVEVNGFLPNVAQHMAQAHLVVSRAGAQTLAELAAVGRGAILVPLTVAHGHQALNAKRLVQAGAGWLLQSPTVDDLVQLLTELLAHRDQVRRASESMAKQATPRAAADLADLIEGVSLGEAA